MKKELLLIINIMPSAIISIIIHTIFHEIGHLLGGLITGWKLLYIRFYKCVIKRNLKNNTLKLLWIKSIDNECIMYPKSINSNFKLYSTGGYIINLLLAIISLIIFIIYLNKNIILSIYLFVFSIYGFIAFAGNGIANVERICNDKACFKLCKEDSITKISHNTQFFIAKYLSEGITYKDIPEEIICLTPDKIKNDIQAYQALLEYYYYIDKKEYNKAEKIIRKIKNHHQKKGSIYKISKTIIDAAELEIDYLKIINLNKVEFKDLKEENNINDIHELRVITSLKSYYNLLKGNKEEALKIINDGIEKMKKLICIYEGEKKFNINQLEEIKKIIVNI